MHNSAYNRWKLIICAVSIAFTLMSLPASADWIRTRAEANEAGSRIRVQIWLSATIGQVIIEDRYLGGYNVPSSTGLKATVSVGAATVDLVIEANDAEVEALVKVHVDGHNDQTEIIKAAINE